MTLETALALFLGAAVVVLTAYAGMLFREVGRQIRTDRAYTREAARLRAIRFKVRR